MLCLILIGSRFSRLCVNFVLATTSRPDTGLHLATVGVVPQWWAFKFQEDEVLRGYSSVFDADNLEGSFLHYFRNGTCYQIRVGMVAQISHKKESECPIFRGMDGENYLYHRSLYGTQIYRSQHPSVVVGKCHTALRLALDMPKVDCHEEQLAALTQKMRLPDAALQLAIRRQHIAMNISEIVLVGYGQSSLKTLLTMSHLSQKKFVNDKVFRFYRMCQTHMLCVIGFVTKIQAAILISFWRSLEDQDHIRKITKCKGVKRQWSLFF